MWLFKGRKTVQSYTNWFTQVDVELEGDEEGLKCWIFENDLLGDYPFKSKIGRKRVRTTQEMMNMVQSYMILEEKLNKWFDNPTYVDTNSSRSASKEFHLWKDESIGKFRDDTIRTCRWMHLEKKSTEIVPIQNSWKERLYPFSNHIVIPYRQFKILSLPQETWQ